MSCGKPDKYRTYMEYPDGQILPLPLPTPSYNWTNMFYQLQNQQALKDHPEMARRFIRTAIGYLFVFDVRKVSLCVFKNVTHKHELASNMTQRKFEEIKLPENESFSPMETAFIMSRLSVIVQNRYTYNTVSDSNYDFKDLLYEITDRKRLAFLLSLMPSSYVTKVGHKNWLEILCAIADSKVKTFCPKFFICADR